RSSPAWRAPTGAGGVGGSRVGSLLDGTAQPLLGDAGQVVEGADRVEGARVEGPLVGHTAQATDDCGGFGGRVDAGPDGSVAQPAAHQLDDVGPHAAVE